MKIKYERRYPEFQCPYCGIDIEDKYNKLLERAVLKNLSCKTTTICGNCNKKIVLHFNDMEGKLMPYKTDKK